MFTLILSMALLDSELQTMPLHTYETWDGCLMGAIQTTQLFLDAPENPTILATKPGIVVLGNDLGEQVAIYCTEKVEG